MFKNDSTDFRQKFVDDYNISSDSTKGQGSEVLPIGEIITTDPANGKVLSKKVKNFFVYGKKTATGDIQKCDQTAKESPTTQCGLYLWDNEKSTEYNLVDAFLQDEDSKRVKISDLKFYISGGDHDTHKVTLRMTVQLNQ